MARRKSLHFLRIASGTWVPGARTPVLALLSVFILACGGTTPPAESSVEASEAASGGASEGEVQTAPRVDPCDAEPFDQSACFGHARALAGDPEVSGADVLATVQRACAVRPIVVPSCLQVGSTPRPPGSYAAAQLYAVFCSQCAQDLEHTSCGFEARLAEYREAIVERCGQRDTNACTALLGMREHGCAADERDDALLASMQRYLNTDALNRLYLLASPQPMRADARGYDFVPRPARLVFGNLGDEGMALPHSDDALLDTPFEGDGLPAISADGRFIAAGRLTGRGTADVSSVVVLRAEDLSLEQVLELGGEDPDEDLTDAQRRSRDRAHRAAATRAAQFLRRGGYRSLARVGPPSGNAEFARGVPLIASLSTRIVVRDPGPGRVRWSGEMPADESGLLAADAAPNPETCTPGRVRVGAWLYPDGTHLLLRAIHEPRRAECAKYTTFARVQLESD